MDQRDVVAVVLAGGKGGRVLPLTEERPKPHLPFAGTHRLIDFPLSNCRHSGISDVWVVQQHNPLALRNYLGNGRPWDLDRTVGGFRILHPYTDPDDARWHEGNAHALFAHVEDIRDADPEVLVVLSADHVYRLDLKSVVAEHRSSGAGVTIVTTEVSSDAGRHGVVETAGDEVTAFHHKPDDPPTNEVATEVFVYDAADLVTMLEEIVDEVGEEELGDFGERLVPRFVERGRARRFRLDGYWRDLGTLGSYWQGHQDLLGREPRFTVDDPAWPILGQWPHRAAAQVHTGAAIEDSLLSPGSEISGRVRASVIGSDVVVEAGAEVEASVLMDGTRVAAGATVVGAILGEHVTVGHGARVGDDPGGERLAVLGDGESVDPGAEVPGEVPED
jgi:glucose-1-phosphate adenylyltransferase